MNALHSHESARGMDNGRRKVLAGVNKSSVVPLL